jgi:TrmH family RNA methyltransferase
VLRRIVLVRPLYAGNVGSVVRVAGNFAVPEVIVVEPSFEMEDIELLRMAMGGLQRVRLAFAPTLAEAVQDSDLVIATTSGRDRDRRGIHTLAEARERIVASGAQTVACVFGSERGGLSRDEARHCHLRLTVPTDPEFPVLNLAQAAAIVVASLGAVSATPTPAAEPLDQPAPLGELEGAMSHLEEVLLTTSYLDPHNPGRVADQWRRWLGRTVPTRREVALLHALAAHIAYLRDRSAGK